jgi:hypothetical protein
LSHYFSFNLDQKIIIKSLQDDLDALLQVSETNSVNSYSKKILQTKLVVRNETNFTANTFFSLSLMVYKVIN